MPDKESLLEYHIEMTDKRFDKIDDKLEKIMRFMWVFIGVSVALSHFGSSVIEMATALAGGK